MVVWHGAVRSIVTCFLGTYLKVRTGLLHRRRGLGGTASPISTISWSMRLPVAFSTRDDTHDGRLGNDDLGSRDLAYATPEYLTPDT